MKPKHQIIFQFLHARDRRLALLFERLSDENRELAAFGIERHLKACVRNESGFDNSALREILTDAKDGRSVAMEIQADSEAKIEYETPVSDLFRGGKIARARAKARV